jgi:hypothetical protein
LRYLAFLTLLGERKNVVAKHTIRSTPVFL